MTDIQPLAFISILSAVLVTMIDVGVTKPIGNGSLKATASLGFTSAFLSVSNITFAYAGHSCYFGFIAVRSYGSVVRGRKLIKGIRK